MCGLVRYVCPEFGLKFESRTIVQSEPNPIMTSALAYPNYNSFSPHAAVLVMRPALQVADDTDFKELRKERKRQTSVSDRILLSLLRPLNASLLEVHESVFQMDSQEAKAVLQAAFTSQESIVTEMRVEITNSFIHPEASEIERELFSLIKSIVAIFEDLQIAADDAPINEASEGYQRFLEKMVAEAVATPPTHGKKALYDLFKD